MDSRIVVKVKLLGPEAQPTVVDEPPTNTDPIRVRLFSEWLPCSCTSDIFGEGIDWTLPKQGDETVIIGNDNDPPCAARPQWSSTFKAAFEADLSKTENLATLNSNPGIYAVFIHTVTDESTGALMHKPVAFSHVDCSSFVLQEGILRTRNIKVLNYEAEFEVSLEVPLLSQEELLSFEPVLIDVNKICAFPLMEGEGIVDAVSSTYIYGEFQLGGGLCRSILGFPFVDAGSGEHQGEDGASTGTFEDHAKFHIDLKVCLLPGLIDTPQVKESFNSATLVLQLHNEDIVKRAFHVRNTEEYIEIARGEISSTDGGGGKGKSTKKGGGKDKSAKKGAPPASDEDAPADTYPSVPMSSGDQFLLQAIKRALTTSRQIRPHGAIRFRLEHLLTSSTDMLRRFARARRSVTGGEADGTDDDHVVIEEDMIVEVRLEKPSKPEKWDLPADISLKSAMARAKQDAQSRLDGTLAVTSHGSGKFTSTGDSLKKRTATVVKSKPPPRHERFFTVGTNISLVASLHRKLLSMEELIGASGVGDAAEDDDIDEEEAEEGDEVSVGMESTMTDRDMLRRLHVTPFTRMIVSFNYMDDHTLHAINDGIDAINSEALPDIQGTIRSYSFTPDEIVAAKEARLDVITGFMIIDDDRRLVVLEGKAAPGCAMQRMFTEFLPREKPNDEALRILCNPEVLFPSRQYPEFGPDIRRIRVRDKLKKLARRPEVYNRKQVEEICFEAIDGLMALRRAVDMESTKKLNLYPSTASLNKLELLYGEAITRLDMDGTKRIEYGENYEQIGSRKGRRMSMKTVGTVIRAASPQREDDEEESYQRRRPEFEPTDCRNPEFEEHLKTRQAPDFLREQRTLLRQAWKDALRRREKKDNDFTMTVRNVLGDSAAVDKISDSSVANAVKGPKVYLYSQQTLNFKGQAFNKLRQRIAKDKTATYSFSKDFISQTVCVVDEAEEQKKSKEKNKAEWLTPSGFLYPKPKTRKELIQHPNRPSEARIEELKEPFTDATDVSANAVEQAKDPALKSLEHGFKTRFKVEGRFGALNPPEYERDFQLKLVGDRNLLPRGHMKSTSLEKDPHCFRSVHLGGEKQAQIVAEAIAQEKQAWKDKVIHDHIDMKVGGYRVRDVAIQSDRTNDILKGEPKREALKHLRSRRSHKDHDWSYKTTPMSILNEEPFESNAHANALVRKTDYTKFITTKLMSEEDYYGMPGAKSSNRKGEDRKGEDRKGDDSSPDNSPTRKGQRSQALDPRPVDFQRYIHKDTFNPKLMSIVSKRKHPAQDPVQHGGERQGPKWEAPQST